MIPSFSGLHTQGVIQYDNLKNFLYFYAFLSGEKLIRVFDLDKSSRWLDFEQSELIKIVICVFHTIEDSVVVVVSPTATSHYPTV